jgi:hypothetical protein
MSPRIPSGARLWSQFSLFRDAATFSLTQGSSVPLLTALPLYLAPPGTGQTELPPTFMHLDREPRNSHVLRRIDPDSPQQQLSHLKQLTGV